jgi:GNAT superfamily N-acetyltransferase
MSNSSTRPDAIAIRTATVGDVDDIARLVAQLHPDHPSDPSRNGEIFREMLRREARHLLVATEAGRVVGTADLLIVDNLSHGGSPWGITENVVVDEGVRSRGVGRALMLEVQQRARAAGCYMIQLVSLKHRRDAHAFYQRVGFDPVAEGFRHYLT